MAASRLPVSSVFRAGLFGNKTAIVTGGATGIGRAIALELLHLGCKVMIASRKEDRLLQAVKDMNISVPESEVEHYVCNIRKEEQVKDLMSHTLERYGKIDFLVNNGGGQFPSAAEDISLKGWHAVVETNLTGTFLCCREAYNQWMKDNGGVIVNIIADMWKGFPGMCHTGAARSAVDNLTKTLSVEWAHSGVRVNAVAPGSTIYSETAAANYSDKAIFEAAIPHVPAKRLGKPEEISAAVCYLMSPAAAFVTGDTIKVDGGHSLYSPRWPLPDHNNLPAYSWEEEAAGKSKL